MQVSISFGIFHYVKNLKPTYRADGLLIFREEGMSRTTYEETMRKLIVWKGAGRIRYL